MKILVAVDGSVSSHRALEFATRLAKDTSAPLTIVTVRQAVGDEDVRVFSAIEKVTVGDILERQADIVLADAMGRARALGANEPVARSADGDPATALMELARDADLLVVGRRGHGRLAGLLLGSVSQKLAALSPCPIVIVP